MAGETGSGVAYVMLGVTDVERSVAFYEQTLGRTVRFRSEGLVFIDAGTIAIGLSPDLGRHRQPLAGAAELVFAVDGVKAAWRALVAKGVPFVNEPRQVTGSDWATTFRDPDGHYLTLFGAPGD